MLLIQNYGYYIVMIDVNQLLEIIDNLIKIDIFCKIITFLVLYNVFWYEVFKPKKLSLWEQEITEGLNTPIEECVELYEVTEHIKELREDRDIDRYYL